MPRFHCFFNSISILVFKMEVMYIIYNGTTSIHVNPNSFLNWRLPIMPFVTFGRKKTMLLNDPKNKIRMTYVKKIFYPNLARKDYGKVARSPLLNRSYQLPTTKVRKHILIGLLLMWRSLMPRFSFFPSFFSHIWVDVCIL